MQGGPDGCAICLARFLCPRPAPDPLPSAGGIVRGTYTHGGGRPSGRPRRVRGSSGDIRAGLPVRGRGGSRFVAQEKDARLFPLVVERGDDGQPDVLTARALYEG